MALRAACVSATLLFGYSVEAEDVYHGTPTRSLSRSSKDLGVMSDEQEEELDEDLQQWLDEDLEEGELEVELEAQSGTDAPEPEPMDPIDLGSTGMKLTYENVGADSMKFTITYPEEDAWLGFGFPTGPDPTMTGSTGADIVFCSAGAIKRSFTTSKSNPASQNPTDVDGSCTSESGMSTMVFTRKIAAENDKQVAITPGTKQPMIFARGNAGTNDMRYHPSRGGAFLFEETTTTTESGTTVPSDGLKLGDTGMEMSFEKVGEAAMKFTITYSGNTWLGFGFAIGNVISMTGEGNQGADIVFCSGGAIKRSFTTRKSNPSSQNPTDVEGSCTTENGASTMTFTRNISAEGDKQVAITPGTEQTIIFARGRADATNIAFHPSYDGLRIDFESGSMAEPVRRSGEATFFLHFIPMLLAWALFLPSGIIMRARFLDPNGVWFNWHRGFAVTGWVFVILGFIMAFVYVNATSSHFANPHAYIGVFVSIVAILQPVNAAFRPHKEPASTGRTVWEVIHRGGGYVAMLLALFNIITGILLAQSKNYNNGVMLTAVILAVVFIMVPVAFIGYSFTWTPPPKEEETAVEMTPEEQPAA